MSDKMVLVSIRLPESVLQRIDQESAANYQTRNGRIRMLIDAGIAAMSIGIAAVGTNPTPDGVAQSGPATPDGVAQRSVGVKTMPTAPTLDGVTATPDGVTATPDGVAQRSGAAVVTATPDGVAVTPSGVAQRPKGVSLTPGRDRHRALRLAQSQATPSTPTPPASPRPQDGIKRPSMWGSAELDARAIASYTVHSDLMEDVDRPTEPDHAPELPEDDE